MTDDTEGKSAYQLGVWPAHLSADALEHLDQLARLSAASSPRLAGILAGIVEQEQERRRSAGEIEPSAAFLDCRTWSTAEVGEALRDAAALLFVAAKTEGEIDPKALDLVGSLLNVMVLEVRLRLGAQ